MIVLLHRVEAWDVVCLLYTFGKFSSIKLYKPKVSHAKRSSFYMIATNIQSQSANAILAVESWKTTWKVATFGTDEDVRKRGQDAALGVSEVLEEFGPELITLGRKVWKVQANALANASFVNTKSRRGSSA
jgi:hypothetical protein